MWIVGGSSPSPPPNYFVNFIHCFCENFELSSENFTMGFFGGSGLEFGFGFALRGLVLLFKLSATVPRIQVRPPGSILPVYDLFFNTVIGTYENLYGNWSPSGGGHPGQAPFC